MSLPVLPSDASSVLRTVRLDLEPMLRIHAAEMFPVLADSSLHEITGGAPAPSVEALADTYGRRESRRSPDGQELWLNWLLRERESGAAIGYVQATVAPDRTWLAWVVGTPWQRRGFASEAATALVAWLRRLGARDIGACVSPRHEASRRVAGRAGLRPTDEVRDGEEVWTWRPGPDASPATGVAPT